MFRRMSIFDPLRTLARSLMQSTMPRLLIYAAVAVTGACVAQHADPKPRDEQCVRDQNDDGRKVSASEARQLVGKCGEAVDEWLAATMRSA